MFWWLLVPNGAETRIRDPDDPMMQKESAKTISAKGDFIF